MNESKFQDDSGPAITTFLPVFRKKLERLEKLGLDDTNEAIDLRRALKVAGNNRPCS